MTKKSSNARKQSPARKRYSTSSTSTPTKKSLFTMSVGNKKSSNAARNKKKTSPAKKSSYTTSKSKTSTNAGKTSQSDEVSYVTWDNPPEAKKTKKTKNKRKKRGFFRIIGRTARYHSGGSESSEEPLVSSEKEAPQPRRLGTNFCGLCDSRVAVSLLSVLHMAVAIMAELHQAAKWGNRNYLKQPPLIMFFAIGISTLGLLGALHFADRMLAVSSVLMLFLFYPYATEMHYVSLVVALVYLPAQIVLIREIRCGIMSKETYWAEEYINPESRNALKTVHGLTVDIGHTAGEFAEEVGKTANELTEEYTGVKCTKHSEA